MENAISKMEKEFQRLVGEMDFHAHRLEKDCAKARIYKELRQKAQLSRQQELVLGYETAKDGLLNLEIRKKDLIQKEGLKKAALVDAEKKIPPKANGDPSNIERRVKEISSIFQFQEFN